MRTIKEIALEIKSDWQNVNYAAAPYLDAMHYLESINDDYICDTGHDIVLRFLGNASTYRGDTARRLKAELKELIK